MGDSNKKEGEGADDLLSKLFDLEDAPQAGPSFGIPTKIDSKVGAPKSGGGRNDFSMDVGKTESFIQDPSEISEHLFDEILSENQNDDSKLSIVESQTSPGEKTQIIEPAPSSAPKPVPVAAGKNPFESGGDKTVVLGSDEEPQALEPVEDLEIIETDMETDPDQTKAVGMSADPIDRALEQFSQEAIAKSSGPKNRPEASPAISEAHLEEVSLKEFQGSQTGGDGLKPITDIGAHFQASIRSKIGRVSVLKRSRRLWMPIVASVLIIAGLSFVWKQLQTDEGLLGYRVDGFSFIKAYRPPTAEVLASFSPAFQATEEALQADSPGSMEEAVGRLKSVLVKDERNLQATALLSEVLARLTYWYGPNSAWPSQYDQYRAKLSEILTRLKKADLPAPAIRAKVWRLMAVEDYGQAYAELGAQSGANDDESYLLMADLALRLQKKSEAETALQKVSKKGSPYARWIEIRVKGSFSELKQMSYLPARIELFLRSAPNKENMSELIKEGEGLLEETKKFPLLTGQVQDGLGIFYNFSGQASKAREAWKVALQISPRSGPTWTRIAESYEEDALWDDALAAYRSADKSKSLNEMGLIKYIRLLRIRGKIVDALSLMEEVLKNHPKSAMAQYEKAMIHLAVYQEDLAKATFQKALELDPNLELAQLGLVQLALQARDWQNAEAALKKIPESSPKYPESLIGLARIAEEQSKVKEAQDFYVRAIDKNPKLEAAYPELVNMYLLEERDDRAEVLVDSGLKALPKSPLLKVSKAKIFQFRGDFDAALEEVSKAAKLFDHIPIVNLTLAEVLIDRKEVDKAYDILNRYKDMEFKEPEIAYLKVKAFLKEPENPNGLGSAEAAQRMIDTAIRRKPLETKFRLLGAQVAVLMQDKKLAVEHVDMILKARPHFAEALSVRGDFFRDTGEYENAVPLYEQALKHTRFKAPIYRRLADSYRNLSKGTQAIQYYQKVVALSPKDSQAHLELGKLLSDDGRYLAALKALTASINLNSQIGEAYYFLGFVQKELGNKKEAIKSFEKFLTFSPGATEASTVRDEIYFLESGTRHQ